MEIILREFNATLVKEKCINAVVTSKIKHSVDKPVAAVVGSAVEILRNEPSFSKVNLSFFDGKLEIVIVKEKDSFAFTILRNGNMVDNCNECCELLLDYRIKAKLNILLRS